MRGGEQQKFLGSDASRTWNFFITDRYRGYSGCHASGEGGTACFLTETSHVNFGGWEIQMAKHWRCSQRDFKKNGRASRFNMARRKFPFFKLSLRNVDIYGANHLAAPSVSSSPGFLKLISLNQSTPFHKTKLLSGGIVDIFKTEGDRIFL